MIADAVSLLVYQVNQYLNQEDGNPPGTSVSAVAGNIARLDMPDIGTDLENHLILSLINLEEETTLKNGRTNIVNSNHKVSYSSPPLHVNLLLLWTANYRNYETSLKRLSQVMTFFQGKNKFTPGNSPGSTVSEFAEFSLIMEFLSLSLEEINHLWGSLGGKQLPFVAYRGRLITLRDQRLLESGGLIREVEITERDIRP